MHLATSKYVCAYLCGFWKSFALIFLVLVFSERVLDYLKLFQLELVIAIIWGKFIQLCIVIIMHSATYKYACAYLGGFW